MDWKKPLAAGFFYLSVLGSVWAASGCQQPNRIGDSISLAGGRKLTVVEQTIVDNVTQSSLRQTLLIDDGQIVTQENARALLTEIFSRAKSGCRRYPLTGALIFLYGSRDTVVGTNWLARLDTRSDMTPSIDLQPALFAGSSGTSRCEGPNAPQPKGKEYRSGDEVTLPPVSQRKILGTWMNRNVGEETCNRSFEEVKGRVFEVARCSGCGGGKLGTPLIKAGANMFTRVNPRNGEYFKILPNGNLGSFDREGLIDNYPRLSGLWPAGQ